MPKFLRKMQIKENRDKKEKEKKIKNRFKKNKKKLFLFTISNLFSLKSSRFKYVKVFLKSDIICHNIFLILSQKAKHMLKDHQLRKRV